MPYLKPKVVLFDIGSTLWSSPAEDPGGLQRVYGRGRDILRLAIPNPPSIDELIHAVEGYLGEWEEIWRTEAHRVEQAPTPVFVADALKRIGVTGLPEDVLIPFTNAVMEASVETAKVTPPEPGMPEALRDLAGLGVRLACVSNAFMGADVLNRIMEERGLGRHLTLTISSCETNIRKPDARIYQAALDAMNTTGPETVFVGDRLDADVEGPSKLGMRTVLTQQYRAEDPAIVAVKPDAVITHLRELPAVVEGFLKE
jgi:FMN phosphatase YigB (HAD superfamily)